MPAAYPEIRLALTRRLEEARISKDIAMRWLGRTSLSVLVWLAAALTVAGGVPHFACRCPDGRTKPICLGSAKANNCGCCCDGKCCATEGAARSNNRSSEKRGPAASCCGHQKQPAVGAPGKSQPLLAAASCTRTLVQTTTITVQPPQRVFADRPMVGELLGVQSVLLEERLTLPSVRGHEGPRPPPINLLTTLQHLLI
jgi:hypothetical protein